MWNYLYYFIQICICIFLTITQTLIIIFLEFNKMFVDVIFPFFNFVTVYYCSFKLCVLLFLSTVTIWKHFYRMSGFWWQTYYFGHSYSFCLVIWPENMEFFLSLCVCCHKPAFLRLDHQRRCPTWVKWCCFVRPWKNSFHITCENEVHKWRWFHG